MESRKTIPQMFAIFNEDFAFFGRKNEALTKQNDMIRERKILKLLHCT